MSHYDVTVNLKMEAEKGSSGFGIPLIFTGKLASGSYEYTECKTLEEVANTIGGVKPTDDDETISSKVTTAKATNAYKAAQLMWSQSKPPAKIAVYGSADACTTALSKIYDKGWRQLVVASAGEEGEDSIGDISSYIETTRKMYFCSVDDVSKASSVKGKKRTICLYSKDDNVVCPEAAIVGASSGKDAGSINYKNMIVAGIEPLELTDQQLKAAHDAGCMVILKKAGDIVTSDGKSTSGYYIDLTDAEDWVILNLLYETQSAMNRYDKLPYDNRGISILENVCVGVIRKACGMGIVALLEDEDGNEGGYDYDVHYAPRSETTAEERSSRKYTRGQFRFTAAGAIDTCEINGVIEI